jgi:hypothetical protein
MDALAYGFANSPVASVPTNRILTTHVGSLPRPADPLGLKTLDIQME